MSILCVKMVSTNKGINVSTVIKHVLLARKIRKIVLAVGLNGI